MPTLPVRIGAMDSRRPAEVTLASMRVLRFHQRAGRGLLRWLVVGGVSLVVANFALLIIPAPHLHLCSLPVALVLGPLAGYLKFRARVVFAPGVLACPRCHQTVDVPHGLEGWPARFNCLRCAIMIELTPALPADRP